jgi:hypothetical protein
MQLLRLWPRKFLPHKRQDGAKGRVRHGEHRGHGSSVSPRTISCAEAIRLLGGTILSAAAPASTLALLLEAVIFVTAAVPLQPSTTDAAKQRVAPWPTRAAPTTARQVIVVIAVVTASRSETSLHVGRVMARPWVGILHPKLPVEALRRHVRVVQRNLWRGDAGGAAAGHVPLRRRVVLGLVEVDEQGFSRVLEALLPGRAVGEGASHWRRRAQAREEGGVAGARDVVGVASPAPDIAYLGIVEGFERYSRTSTLTEEPSTSCMTSLVQKLRAMPSTATRQ